MGKIIVKIIDKFNNITKKCKILFYKLKYGNQLEIGKNISFRKSFIINISKNGFLKIGDNNFFNNYCSINCHDSITIGDDNLFGENVKIYDHDHVFNDLSKNKKNEFLTSKIEIGNDNWIGSNVIILRKTKIRNKNVIGAGVILNETIGSDRIVKSYRENIVDEIKYKK